VAGAAAGLGGVFDRGGQFGAMRGALGLLPVVVPLFVVFLLLGWINRSVPHPTAR